MPERRDLLGSWISSGFGDVTIRMTVTETVRAVEGAGSWLTPTTGAAFRISGAVAVDEVSLYFDFDGQSDLNFQGYFRDEDALQGFITGGPFRRQEITFDRDDLLVE